MNDVRPPGRVRLHRYGQFTLSARSLRVFIDNQQVGKIRNGKTEDYVLPVGHHTIQVRVNFFKSRTLNVQVEPEQVVALRCGQNLRAILNLEIFGFFNRQYLCLERDEPGVPSAISTGWENWLLNLAFILGWSALILLAPSSSRVVALVIFIVMILRWRGRSLMTDGMAPTLKKGDRALIRRWRQPPQRGDIVQFQAVIAGQKASCISRVVGLPEEDIKLEPGMVWINDHPLPVEPHLERESLAPLTCHIPANAYFVLADNPSHSQYDSRTLGTIPAAQMRGVVRGILWPWSRLKSF